MSSASREVSKLVRTIPMANNKLIIADSTVNSLRFKIVKSATRFENGFVLGSVKT